MPLTARRVRRTACALLLGMLPLGLFAQTEWTLDGQGRLASEIKPVPVWESGRILLDDRLDAALQLRQSGGNLQIDYNLAGFLAYNSERELAGDLSQLNASIQVVGFPGSSGIFQLEAGRQNISDPAHLVIDQPGDGLSIGTTLPGFRATVTAAYFGLLLKQTNYARFLPSDTAALSDPNVVLAPPRMAALLSIGLPRLLLDTDLVLWGGYFTDLSDPASVRRWYAGIGEEGPIWGPFSQSVDLVTGAAISGLPSLLGTAKVLVTLPHALDSSASIEFSYATGDSPTWSSFLPLNDVTAGVIMAVPYTNLALIGAEYSFHPLNDPSAAWLAEIEPFIRGRTYFKPMAGPASAIGYDPSGSYYGTEAEAGVRYRRGTDPSVLLSGGLFADAAGGVRWFGHLSFALEF